MALWIQVEFAVLMEFIMSSKVSVISNAKHKIFPQKIKNLLYNDGYIFHKKVGWQGQQYFYVKDGKKTELGKLTAEGKNYKVFFTDFLLSLLKDGQLKTLARGRLEKINLTDRYMVYNYVEGHEETEETPIGPWFLVDFETEEIIKTDLWRDCCKVHGTSESAQYYENYLDTGKNVARFKPRGVGVSTSCRGSEGPNFMEIPSGKIISDQEMQQLVYLARVAKDPSYRG